MQRILAIAFTLLLISGCTSEIEFHPDGSIKKIKGESLGMSWANAEAVKALKDAPPPCQIAPLEEISQLSEGGEVAYFDAMEECFDGMNIAVSHGRPMSIPGEVANQGSKAIQAAENSEASIASSAVGGAVTLGLGVVAGNVAKAAVEGAQGDTYNVGNVAQSNSVNGSGAGGGGVPLAEGETAAPGATSNANGTRTGVVHIGPGNVTIGTNDQAPSAQVQNNVAGGQVDKPVSQDCATCEINDDDGQNDTSLF